MPAAPTLPHAYPFRFVDAVLEPPGPQFDGGRVMVRVASNARAAMGAKYSSRALLAELVAQAALMLEGGDVEVGRRGFLAGIEGFEVVRTPEAGETLAIDVRLSARFGAIVRFEGEVRSGSETVARGAILVRRGIPL